MDYYLSGKSSAGHCLVISPISADMAIAHKISRDDSLGYFLYQKRDGAADVEAAILAKIPTEDAAFALGMMLGLH